LPQLVHSRRGDVALHGQRRAVRHLQKRRRAQSAQRGQQRPECVRRGVQAEVVDRLAHDGPGSLHGAHQHQRRQLPVVLAGARQALVEALVAETVLAQVAGVGQRDGAIRYLPAVDALAQRLSYGVLGGPEERDRHGAKLHLDPERHARAGRGGSDAQPDGGQERVGRLMQPLDRGAGTGHPLDADRGRLAETDLQAEVRRQRGPDHLLLDLAEQRDGDLPAGVVPADVDQRVLLGEPGERGGQGAGLVATARNDDRLQCRRREPMLLGLRPRRADHVADLDLGQAPQLGDLSGRNRLAPDRLPVGEDVDTGHPPRPARPEPHPVPGAHPAGEHADVGDLLARRAALDLEHLTARRAARVPPGAG
jgi:hypothetical protein